MTDRHLLALDTNLQLLYLVTRVDLVLLRRFKRVARFSYVDVVALQELVNNFAGFIGTPHVMAEVSNFLDQAPSPWRTGLLGAFRVFASESREVYEPATSLVTRKEFFPLGLADTGLLALREGVTVATLDYELYGRMLNRGQRAVYFNHLRGRSSE